MQEESKNTRIRLVHLQLLPLLSGVQRVSLEELRGLDQEDYELHLICNGEGPLTEEARKLGVICHVLPFLLREISPVNDVKALMKLRALLRVIEPDVLHTHSSKTGVLGRLAGSLAHVPVVVHTVHGFAFPAAGSWGQKLLFGGMEFLGGVLGTHVICLNETDRLITVRYLLVPEHRVSIVPNGVEHLRYQPLTGEGREQCRRDSLGLSDGFHAVGMVARLAPQKNPQEFLSIACAVQAKRPNTRFYLFGDGEMKEELEKGISDLGASDFITLMGWQEDVHTVLPGLDVFLLTSKWEGLPLVLLEAMSSGLPVVATDIPGNRDIVNADQVGALYGVGEIDEGADQVIKLLGDDELRQRQGCEARRVAVEKYGLPVRLERVKDLYAQLLEKRHENRWMKRVLSISLVGLLVLFLMASWSYSGNMRDQWWVPLGLAEWADDEPVKRTGLAMVVLSFFLALICLIRWPKRGVWFALFAAMLFLGFAEFGQFFVKWRRPRLGDMGWGCLGSLIGASMAYVFMQLRVLWQKKKNAALS